MEVPIHTDPAGDFSSLLLTILVQLRAPHIALEMPPHKSHALAFFVVYLISSTTRSKAKQQVWENIPAWLSSPFGALLGRGGFAISTFHPGSRASVVVYFLP